MPDKFRLDSALSVELLLEGEDDQHLAHVLAYQLDTRLPPRPQLWADVINHRDAALVQFAGQPKVEVGEVDQHSRVWSSALGFVDNFVKEPEDSRQVLDHLDQSDHGNLIGVDDEIAARLLHLLAADAEKLRSRTFRAGQLAQCVHQLRAV